MRVLRNWAMSVHTVKNLFAQLHFKKRVNSKHVIGDWEGFVSCFTKLYSDVFAVKSTCNKNRSAGRPTLALLGTFCLAGFFVTSLLEWSNQNQDAQESVFLERLRTLPFELRRQFIWQVVNAIEEPNFANMSEVKTFYNEVFQEFKCYPVSKNPYHYDDTIPLQTVLISKCPPEFVTAAP